MSEITEKKLIEQIKMLKEIKPNEKWASLLLSQIVEQKPLGKAVVQSNPARLTAMVDAFFGIILQKKLAYSLASFMFVIVGVLGFANYTMPGDLLFPIKRLGEQSQANLMGQTELAQNIANLNSRINDLAKVSKQSNKSSIPSVIKEIKANASELTKVLKNTSADKKEVKEIVSTLKTLADFSGTDLNEFQDVQDLYQEIVVAQIIDLKKTTLTLEQKKTLVVIEALYEEGKYMDALENILLIQP